MKPNRNIEAPENVIIYESYDLTDSIIRDIILWIKNIGVKNGDSTFKKANERYIFRFSL